MTQKGFTLLEVLVALTLTGLLVATLFAGFRVGVDSWHTAERHVHRVEDGRQLVSLIGRHLAQVQPARVLGEGNVAEPAFRGTASSLRYVAPLSLSVGNRLYLFEIVSDHEDMPGTWVRFAPWHHAEELVDMLAETEFQQVSETTTFGFAYLSEEETAGWVDEYLSAPSLPRLVAVQVRDERGPWPRLILATGGR